MPRMCQICNKTVAFGRTYSRRGLAKKKGGVGRRITGKSLRKFAPNLQKVRVLSGGSVKRMRVCTACIRSGRIQKAP